MVKILSNFDTRLHHDLMKECCERYGEENVIFVRRDYIYFVFNVIIPIIIWLILAIVLLVLMYVTVTGHGSGAVAMRWIGWGTFGLTLLVLIYKVVFSMMDYYLDFTIITPKQISDYNQTGFFSRSIRTLDMYKIKSTRVDQHGIFRSIWNYGSIVFLSEGDRQDL